jgi:KUP system potassium uptake protein
MSHSSAQGAPRGRYLVTLSLTALGVVYGDIGTSVLYALRECFYGAHAVTVVPENVLGILSLIFWSLLIIVTVKYLVFVMRADNRGEGGILALTSLIGPMQGPLKRGHWALILGGIFGTALLYGDGMITPAISVLSAVEGLSVATPFFDPYVIPITIVVLVMLFSVQSRGSAQVGSVFGPVMMLWFATLAGLGIVHIAERPEVLAAVNPYYAVSFFARNGTHGFLVLGSVFLCVTGGEALYADMGHFGRRPIRLAWYLVVLPALLLNYFGQGAFLLGSPEGAENPFYRMAPAWALYPLVLLATMATVIASQALITGAYSLTMQAIQLGFSPRMEIDHTSASEFGQIYMPGVNWALMVCCIGLVVGFGSSTNLAAAYGIAVTSTMVLTTILFYFVARNKWHWPRVYALPLMGFFLVVDGAFFGANVIKIPHGGWFPLLIAAIVFTLMVTWKRGRQILNDRMRVGSLPLDLFLQSIKGHPPTRVSGTAIFMYGASGGTPPALLHSLKHYKVIHQTVVFLAVVTEEVSHVPDKDRATTEVLGDGFYRIILRYGFMQDPNIPEALKDVQVPGLEFKPAETTYFLGRETLIPSQRPGMALWREKLFASMSRNARPATAFFKLPPNRVVELGAQIEL